MKPQNYMSEKKRFSIIARAVSFKHALRGVWIVLKTQHNFWVHVAGVVVVIVLGIFLHTTPAEWSVLILAMTAVLVTEAINTALEIDIDLTSPEYHPYAKDTKDVAAGAVLLSVVGAIAIGGIIFIPKILPLFY